MDITESLKRWYASNKRDLPWRSTKNPYKIWLSEIILQQTRVNQGIDYYYRFIEQYPDISALANAPIDHVMKNWQGLGYYNRARNMHETAKVIHHQFNNKFPASYSELIKLKGIGEYTAAAISSFAFDEPVAVVDGNVQRFLSRLFGIETPFNSGRGKKEFRQLAENLLDQNNPGLHNQAMIEFGATFCVPRNPNCPECPFNDSCYAYANGTVAKLPVKSASKPKKNRYFNYIIITSGSKTYIHRRENRDIWRNLYQFPLIETNKPVSSDDITGYKKWEQLFNGLSPEIQNVSSDYTHILSHQKIKARFIRVEISKTNAYLTDHFKSVHKKELENYAVPRLIERFLENENIE